MLDEFNIKATEHIADTVALYLLGMYFQEQIFEPDSYHSLVTFI